jgi:transcription antitermination factor NusG
MSSVQQLWPPTLAAPALRAVAEEPRWYALHTRPRHEKSVTEQLQRLGITTFLPLIPETHRWSDRQKTIQCVLFDCYTFVGLESYAQKHLPILQTPGVVGFVGIRGLGLPIPDKEIEDIRTLLAHHIPCTPYPFLRLGRRVRIRGGCMDGLEGILVAQNSDQSLVVSVEMIQRSLAVRIEGYDVEPIGDDRGQQGEWRWCDGLTPGRSANSEGKSLRWTQSSNNWRGDSPESRAQGSHEEK